VNEKLKIEDEKIRTRREWVGKMYPNDDGWGVIKGCNKAG